MPVAVESARNGQPPVASHRAAPAVVWHARPRPKGVTGMWLSRGPVRTPIETLLLDMLEPKKLSPALQRSVIEELNRPVKRTEVVLEYLDLQAMGVDVVGEVPLLLVSPQSERDPWRETLLLPGGDCPIGMVVNTCDRGRLVLVHEVFAQFSPPQKDLVRRYAALAVRGTGHERIVGALATAPEGVRRYMDLLAGARQQVRTLDPSVLFSPDGEVRVQLGSPPQTIWRHRVPHLPELLRPEGPTHADRRDSPSAAGAGAVAHADDLRSLQPRGIGATLV
ncbi:MAG: hypothetical protein HYZ81_21840 [Nitrospinae bacterium]|nr:hypothetical protein [Nitrospinota bacterium]